MTRTTRQDSAAWALVARQHGVITRRQLLRLGFTTDAIAHRLAIGRLWPVHRGVYAVGRPDLSQEGRWMAAVLACGPGAALSHVAAALLWGIWEWKVPPAIDVTVPASGGRTGPDGVRVHRAETLARADRRRRRNIPVTSLGRTLLDLAWKLDARQLRAVLRQAERAHRLDLAALRSHVEKAPRRSTPASRLRKALDSIVPQATESDLEDEFFALCGRFAIPHPDAQVPVGRVRADFMWRDLWLVAETDGRTSHDGYVAFEDDRVKDRALKRADLEVIRFTAVEVNRRPEVVATDVIDARARMARRLAASPRPPFGAVEL